MDLHSASVGCNFGEIGTSLVAIFFFVIARGNTTVSCMMFSHRSDRHSEMRHAVKRQTESAVCNFGWHTAMILSSCSGERLAACPDRFVLTILICKGRLFHVKESVALQTNQAAIICHSATTLERATHHTMEAGNRINSQPA